MNDMPDVYDDMTDMYDMTYMYEYHIHVWYHIPWGDPKGSNLRAIIDKAPIKSNYNIIEK